MRWIHAAVVMGLCFFSTAFAYDWSTNPGDGSADNPYQISTAEQLISIGSDSVLLSKKYILTNDIDMTGQTITQAVIAPYIRVGYGFQKTQFVGKFNGNGHIISNLMISADYDYVGLFGCVGWGGQVSNLRLVNVNITGNYYVGGLCGDNYGIINQCYSTGIINGWSCIGGLCGVNRSTLNQSYSKASVNGEFTTGGLCGWNYNGKITGCYSIGLIFESGLGLCGEQEGDSSIIQDSFWDKETSHRTVGYYLDRSHPGTIINVTGKTTTEMQILSTFTGAGWDFSNTDGDIADWDLLENEYPRLIWEITTITPDVAGVTQQEAEIALFSINLKTDTIYTASNTVPAGRIISQVPAAGEEISCGSTVKLTISLGPKYAGSGTEDNPYLITNINEFLIFAFTPADYSSCFVLKNDIDLAEMEFARAVIAPDINSDNWEFQGTAFVGILDGDGHVINNLTINDVDSEYIGLLGQIGPGGQVKNLRLNNVNNAGNYYIGGLCGESYGVISQCFVSGSITGENFDVGGICASNRGLIRQSYSTGIVTGEGSVGGLCGDNIGGTINQCYATGEMAGTEYIGGLCGRNDGTINQCYATSAVTGEYVVGGLCSYNFGAITDCYWDIESSSQIGGAGGWGLTGVQMKQSVSFAGWNDGSWTIDEGNGAPRLSWENAVGNTITTDYIDQTYAGSGTSENPYRIVDANDLLCLGRRTPDWSGHFILAGDIDLTDITFTEAVIAGGGGVFNGTFDGNNHIIRHLRIHGPDQGYVGLFGQIGLDAQVSHVTITDVNSIGRDFVGGLCGYNYGRVNQCSVSGSVNGVYICVGGLCGINSGTITKSFFSGILSGGAWSGGLCGDNDRGTISQCYAMGSLTGGMYAGGICGTNEGIINQCYAADIPIISGICVANSGTVSNSFWDINISGWTYSTGGTGKTTAQMKTLSTFTDAGWDFTAADGDPADWYMLPDYYPLLCGFPNVTCPNVVGISLADVQASNQSTGFILYVTGEVYSTSIPVGYVVSQSPEEGINVNIGSIINLVVSAGRGGGSGTTSDPIQIWTAKQFYNIGIDSTTWDKYFILMDDVDMSAYTETQCNIIGNYEAPFTGTFDGNGKKIINFTYGNNESTGQIGLFGFTRNAIIKNLAVENVNISGDAIGNGIGGLIGLSMNTVIQNCSCTGLVYGVYEVGGLIGSAGDTTVFSCSSTCAVDGGFVVGGLIGNAEQCSISFCYAAGSVVSTEDYTGGLTGQNSGWITSCYALGNVLGASNLGGLTGVNNRGVIVNSYARGAVCSMTENAENVGGFVGVNFDGEFIADFWDMESSGQAISAGGEGKTTAEMKILSTFTGVGWDFVNETANGTNDIWRMCADGVDYPRLSWESIDGDFACPDGVSVEDLDYFVGRWLVDSCDSSNNYCGGADIDGSGKVDLGDYSIFAQHWLEM